GSPLILGRRALGSGQGELVGGPQQAGEGLAAAGDREPIPARCALHVPAETPPEFVGTDGDCVLPTSGARGTRTPDLSAASRTLSQLSYGPEGVVRSHVN